MSSRNTSPSRLRVWARDLRMGAAFAVGGGREGWTRTLLTGIGVGLGVALLLITTALPGALTARDARADARSTNSAPSAERPGHDTLVIADADTPYFQYHVYGRQVRPEGPDAPLPPGLKKFPAPGELAVSPALDRLLKSGEGALLRERLSGKVTATIGDQGLTGPNELAFYQGSDTIQPYGQVIQRVTGFANHVKAERLDPVLTLLVITVFVALLTPVAVFVAAAVRTGGERRDRRLAALRLVGTDSRMTRRIAAGEALAGAVIGLGLGAGFFLLVRHFAERITILDRGVFSADLDPSPWLALLVALAVPAAAVAVTLFALRHAVIEPLGVVRAAKPAKRRMWWRVLLPLGGLALLLPLRGHGNDNGQFNQAQVIGGVVLLLVGITALLPWLVETAVARLGGRGPVAWQLAVRRLQISSGTAARTVNGIAVAVAGAIALQMLFAGVEGNYTKATGQDPSRAAAAVLALPGSPASGHRFDDFTERLNKTPGIARTTRLDTIGLAAEPKDPRAIASMTIGTCDALRELATLPSCKDGDTFVLTGGDHLRPEEAALAVPGRTLYAGPAFEDDPDSGKPVKWTLPKDTRTVQARPSPSGGRKSGVLTTPKGAPQGLDHRLDSQVYVQLDKNGPDGMERVRTAAYRTDLTLAFMPLHATKVSNQYANIRTGLYIGATCVLVLIGASMLVSQLEQLRERKKLLSALVAIGTRRSTLSLSVLWQTAIPIALGLLLAAAVGLALGAVLMAMSRVPIAVNWASVTTLAGIGVGIVLLVTALGLPPLLRLLRPDGLRTE
ncbi:ABC transporter permease [Streptomyces gamaensis]|uniref:ABC transporter permease n=1 Tax=Streptomyces gamaensis TaxID=1763542 RepID=A0ABW0Z0Q6_9ACTN